MTCSIAHLNCYLNFLPAYSRKTKLGCESKERKRDYISYQHFKLNKLFVPLHKEYHALK